MTQSFADRTVMRAYDVQSPGIPDGEIAHLEEANKEGPWQWYSQSLAGAFAIGSLKFLRPGRAGDTINIDGHEIKLKTSVTEGQVLIVPNSPLGTADNLRTYLAGLAPGVVPVTAAGASTTVTLRAITRGLAGNLIALSTKGVVEAEPPVEPSGPWLTGGQFSCGYDKVLRETAWNGAQIAPAGETDVEVRVAPSSAPVGSSGAWHYARTLENDTVRRINPTFFGQRSVTNFAHNRRMLQAAVWVSSVHGYLVEVDEPWEVDGCVRMLNGSTMVGIDPDAAIINVSTHQNDAYRSPVRLGGWAARLITHPSLTDQNTGDTDDDSYVPHIRWVPCTQPDPQRPELIRIDPKLAYLFPVGCTLFVRESDYYYYSGFGHIPFYLMPNVRMEASLPAGDIQLLHPIDRALQMPLIGLATHPVSLVNGVGQDSRGLKKGKILPDAPGWRGRAEGGPITVARDVRIENMKLESRYESEEVQRGTVFAPNTALLDCTIHLTETKGRTCVAFNCLAHSNVEVEHGREVSEKAVEVALGGGESSITIGLVDTRDHGDSNVEAIINIGENVYATRVQVDTLNIHGNYNGHEGDGKAYVATLRAASACQLYLGTVNMPMASPTVQAWNGAVIGVINTPRDLLPDPQSSQSATRNIKVEAKEVKGGTCASYVVVSNAGGELFNVDIKAKFKNRILRPAGWPHEAVRLDGPEVTFNGCIMGGNIDVTGTTNAYARVHSAGSASAFVGKDDATGENLAFTAACDLWS